MKLFCLNRITYKMYDFQLWEDRDGRKAMSKNNAKGLTTIRQKVRRYIRDFETQMISYREVTNNYFI